MELLGLFSLYAVPPRSKPIRLAGFCVWFLLLVAWTVFLLASGGILPLGLRLLGHYQSEYTLLLMALGIVKMPTTLWFAVALETNNRQFLWFAFWLNFVVWMSLCLLLIIVVLQVGYTVAPMFSVLDASSAVYGMVFFAWKDKMHHPPQREFQCSLCGACVIDA